MHPLIEYARRPYPRHRNRWLLLLSISAFVTLFMLVFQPFGLHQLQVENRRILLAGYGLVTLLVLVVDLIILQAVFPGIFSENRWTLLKEALFLLWIILTLTVGNYAYSVLLAIVPWAGTKGLLIFAGYTLAIAVPPIVVLVIVSYNRLLRRNLSSAKEINRMITGRKHAREKEDRLIINSENRTQTLETRASGLICIESVGNYVNIWTLEEGKIVRQMMRSTLKEIERQVEKAGSLFKCHRAFIINLQHVEKVNGNSQGYRLRMKYLDQEVPVARNYSKSFREAMAERY